MQLTILIDKLKIRGDVSPTDFLGQRGRIDKKQKGHC